MLEICWDTCCVKDCRYPLYKGVPGSEQPKDMESGSLHLYCPTEELYVDMWEYDDCSRPVDEIINCGRSWPISPYLTRDQINELLEKVVPDAEKVIAGFSVDWCYDTGHYDDGAEEAVARIKEIADSYNFDKPSDEDDFRQWLDGTARYREVPNVGSYYGDYYGDTRYPLFNKDATAGSRATLGLQNYYRFGEIYASPWEAKPTEDYNNPLEMDIVWQISPYLRDDQIRDLFRKVAPLATEALAGYFFEDPDRCRYTKGGLKALNDIAEIAKIYNDDGMCDHDDFTRWLEKENNEAASTQAAKSSRG